MILKNLLSLLALRDPIVIVDALNDGLYEGVVEDVPRDLMYLPVTSIAAEHDFNWGHDYLWIEVIGA